MSRDKIIIVHAPTDAEKALRRWLESNRCARCGVVTIPDDEIWCKGCRPDRGLGE
ncbi:hypothetical protein [Paenibacillus sp. BR1-192]|uniref:hypothetical protein n=1 Tax=Paenibacillus sp. BR1-192 TaxID=3032287 RepID=UPI00240E2287|nr:hypothetical protein [Paenibacillus sp. BR1-192]WFB57490.1 hypothetical protein P0X86_26530 [Paenibacillus sp. BR1-192]